MQLSQATSLWLRLSEFWHWLTTSAFTRRLEAEVERLEAENRAMLNSLLTRAGVQPIDSPQPLGRTSHRQSRYQRQVQLERDWIARQQKPDAGTPS